MSSRTKYFTVGLLACGAALGSSLAHAGAYRDVVLSDNPVAYWRLGEPSVSSAAVDESGHGHSGAYSTTANLQLGVTGALTGDANPALKGVGSPGYPVTPVLVGDAPEFDLGSAMTLEAWFKSTPGIGDNQAFIDRRSALPPSFYSYYLGTAFGEGCIAVVVQGVRGLLCAGPNVYDAQWHHIVGTYDGAQLRLYVDGTLQGTQPQTGTVDISDRELGIGSYANADNVLYGSLDEVAMYAEPLAGARVKQHYDAGLGLYADPTATASATQTITPTQTATSTPSFTHTPTSTHTATATSISTATQTLTETPNPTTTSTPTSTLTPTDTLTPTTTSTATATPTSTPTPDLYSLVLSVVRLRIDTGAGNGRLLVRGIVSDVDTGGDLEATLLAGLAAFRVSDAGAYDAAVPLTGCERFFPNGRISCHSSDGKTRATFKPLQAPLIYSMRLTRSAIGQQETGAIRPSGPVRVSLHQDALEREDSIEACIGKGETRVYCRE